MKRLISATLLAAALVPAVLSASQGRDMPVVTLAGDTGGLVDGQAWSSESLKGKVHLLFYVDPDKKDLNEHAAEAVKARAFDRDLYGSVAVINMEASWMPNLVLERALASKQEKYPDTVYVKDMDKVLVREWGVADDENDVLVFDSEGKLVFYRPGKLSEDDVAALIQTIEGHLPR